MLYLDLAIYIKSLPTEVKIVAIQIGLLFLELVYFLYLRRYFKQEKEKIYKKYGKNI